MLLSKIALVSNENLQTLHNHAKICSFTGKLVLNILFTELVSFHFKRFCSLISERNACGVLKKWMMNHFALKTKYSIGQVRIFFPVFMLVFSAARTVVKDSTIEESS